MGQASHPIGSWFNVSALRFTGKSTLATYIEETIIVGIIRRGIMSKKNRENSHAEGLGVNCSQESRKDMIRE